MSLGHRFSRRLRRALRPRPQVRTCPRCGRETARRVNVKSAMGSIEMCTRCGHVRRWDG